MGGGISSASLVVNNRSLEKRVRSCVVGSVVCHKYTAYSEVLLDIIKDYNYDSLREKCFPISFIRY